MAACRAVLAAVVLALGWPAVATAHSLIVFAAVEGDEVVVEAKFSNGRPAQTGEVRVRDGDGTEIRRLSIEPGAPIRFDIGPEAEGGLVVEVSADEGHENYWILTPRDIAEGRERATSQ